jgi:AraC-like DNA-binding protein
MSEEAFSRFFSKMMNKPFFTFLNEYRINAACQLLIETDQPVSEVATASGFETLPFFYRQFSKFKKLSPKKFRDQFRVSSLQFRVDPKNTASQPETSDQKPRPEPSSLHGPDHS